jgi:hypothetical protein
MSLTGFKIVAILYFMYNAITAAYHAGKGDFTITYSRREQLIGASVCAGLALLIVILP